jgi:RNA polymerase sigma-54 factor
MDRSKMALSARLQMRQSQALVMTPQLLQSIRLLQFTHAELERFVEEEIERNPLLERDERPEGEAGERIEEPQHAENSPTNQDVDHWFEEGAGGSAAAAADQFDTSVENLFPDEAVAADGMGPDLQMQWKSAQGAGSGLDAPGIEEFAVGRPTLRDHVAEQIAFSLSDPRERLIAADLADNLDEAGYLRADLAEIAERLGAEERLVAGVLSRCQEMEPPGLFARDLAECLAIQLRVRDRFDPAMQGLVANLDLLARRDFAQLKRICRVGEDDLLDMLAEIRALDPRPGLAFSVGVADPVVPDIIVKPTPQGEWAVELNPETLPRVLVNQAYYQRVSPITRDVAEKEFLSECLQSANWLARSLDQRARTILKVASEIVRQQDAFLVDGVKALRPLNLKTVAEKIAMHESTVSRVTANKYMMTPRGLFELRYFFSVAIASAEGGDAHSSEAVRHRIRELIDAESVDDVLSDDAIVDILRKGGVDIARRTVAKYREGMAIPSSVQRRREKRALASAGA